MRRCLGSEHTRKVSEALGSTVNNSEILSEQLMQRDPDVEERKEHELLHRNPILLDFSKREPYSTIYGAVARAATTPDEEYTALS